MAAAQILSVANTAANSADLVVVAGSPVTVALKGVDGAGVKVRIMLKDDAGAYHQVRALTTGLPALVITGPGTYRFTRVAGGTCGVFSA